MAKAKGASGTSKARASGAAKKPNVPAVAVSSKKEQIEAARCRLLETGKLHTTWPETIQGFEINVCVSHPAFAALQEAARALLDTAQACVSPEATAAGHIAEAIVTAIKAGDLGALNAEGAPHSWARKYLRSKRRPVLPVDDPKGRLLKNPRSIRTGFRMVESILHREIEAGRAQRPPAYPVAGDWLVLPLVFSFPAIATLAGKSTPAQWEEIERRITPQLRTLMLAKRREEAPAADILQSLLETECKLSGWTPEEIRKAFHFRDH